MESKKLIDYLRENFLVVGFGLIGLIMLGVGVWPSLRSESPAVEIVRGDEDESPKSKFVDVSGAVEKPGVYELEGDSRIGQALALAGGLSVEADRVWVARFVNLAAPVTDGMKIYIPVREEGQSLGVAMPSEVVGGGEVIGVVAGSGGVNINTATTSELDALWGIGEKRAGDIILNRPYGEVEELMAKAGIPKNVYERIKDEVSVY